MLQYSKKVIEHFRNPKNQGAIKDADAVGQEGNAACGDVMKMYLKIDQKKGADYIKDVKFETLGCAASIAVSSALTEMIKGKTLEEAMNVSKDDVAQDLGGLPPIKMHCSMLGVDTLHTAIKNYKPNK